MNRNSQEESSISTIIFTIKTMFNMDKLYLLLLFISMITMSILPFMNANLVSYIVNLAVAGNNNNLVVKRIILVVCIIVALESIDAFVLWFRSNHYIGLGHKFDVIVARKTLSMRYEYTESPKISDLRLRARKAGSDVPVAAEAAVELGANIVKTIGCAVVFTMFNPWILVMVVMFTIINYACSRYFQHTIYENEKKEYPYRRKSEHFLITMLDYIAGKEIRVFSAANIIKDKYSEAEESVYKIQKDIQGIRLKDRLVGLIIVVIQLVTIYFMTGLEFYNGNAQIGDVILYINLILVFSSSFQGIFYRILDINFRGKRLKDFKAYMELDVEDVAREKVVIDTSAVKIEFDHVWFKYPGSNDYILKDLTFTLDNQKKYAIVGQNGSGKTTLIKLLMRFYLPAKGRILINGIDYEKINTEQLYSLFTAVFQDFKLLAYSIAENIDFTVNGERNDEKIEQVLKRQGMIDRVRELKAGIDTCISQEFSPEGENFSGGERQKLAIARADYKDAKVFVLDEPASALDPIAEKKLYDNLNKIIDNKMIIIISHRLQSVMLCDKILYLKNGEITESGTHDELMRIKKDYSAMFEVQSHWYE